MELLVRLFLTSLGIFLCIGLLQYECKKLDGYTFPVYSTKVCPRNQTEWNERSSAINCTKDNGYLCFPNEKFTKLLEFCHKSRFIWIEKGSCLYLNKVNSAIYPYSCSSFQSGCHNSSFPSHDLFKHSSCTSIGNGCFLAEPSCKGSDTTTSPQETTEATHVEIVTRNYITTASPNEKGNLKYKDIFDEIVMMSILAGVLIPFTIFCILCVIYKKVYHICIRKSDIESPVEDDCIPLLTTTNQNKEEMPFDRVIFDQWQEDNEKFVPTRACEKVEKLIKSKSLVVVTGNSGSGKSAIIQHVALGYRSDGWTLKPVYSVKDIIDACSTQDALDGTLLVFNDPIGNESFDEEKYELWKDFEERLKGCLRKIKILVSCRRYILKDAQVRGILKDKSCIIDLCDDQYKLNNDEKRQILKEYSSNRGLLEEDINEIIKTEEYFPLLCKLYFSDENKRKGVLQFFTEPVKVYKHEINYFKKKCKDSYCALVLLVLCNNQLCVEDIHINDCLKKKFEIALNICKMKNISPHTIGEKLKSLQGFFVKKIGDSYHFYHDFVMEVTTYVFGTDYPKTTIQYADIGFIRRRVNMKSSNDQNKEANLENSDRKNDKFTICLNDEYVKYLGERLFDEMFGDSLLDVVLHPCMRNEKLVTFFRQKINENPDKLSKLLTKAQLDQNFIEQEDNQAFKQSFGSKLAFLFFENEVPILNAIIVFCHTNISKHCLETLQQMQNSLEGTSLLSAVCCNGSMDLFNVFPKEQIKTLLMENWWECYPIHIVSLFHNHEILQKLIQVKNEVNLNTIGRHGYTPLMLAVSNTGKMVLNKKHPRNQPIDITVELLLNHGADINLCHLFDGSPLHMASVRANDYTAQHLLDKGADINSRDPTKKRTPLHIASKKGHESTVQLLLDNGADFNSCDENYETSLHKASIKGHENIVQLLLDKGADINSGDKNEESPLHKASELGHESIVQLLLHKGADINSCDRNKESPLHKACKKEQESIIQRLLDNGADINSCDQNKETPLHIASIKGFISIAQLLLEKGADINSCDENEEFPLHKASEKGYESIVQLLLNKGADMNSCDAKNETPLHKASEKGHESIVQLLLDKEADINSCDENGETALHKASQNGHENIVQLLLDKEADINSCDENKEFPLLKASECGHESIVQLLLDKGADINSCDKSKETPLHKAIKWGDESTVQLLLDNGANINSCDENEETPLHKASKKGFKSIVQLLLEKGADINSCDKNKESPLLKASECGHENIVKLLLDKGADISSCAKNKDTPLHRAIKRGCERIVILLIEKGADINSDETNKENLLRYASKWGFESLVQLLLEKGADINSCDKKNQTPLHKAIEFGNKSTVQLLLDKGADINSCDENEESPLLKASALRQESIAQLLLDKGADIGSCDKNQETALHKASKKGFKSIVQLLLDKGADINSYDKNKETPLHKASKKGFKSIVQLLLDKGADINSCDENKETSVHKACKKKDESIVQLLLNKGADINLCDETQKTPLHEASEMGFKSIVHLLLEKGADINSFDENKQTPLHQAIKWMHKSIIKLLIEKGADINSGDEKEKTPLMYACRWGLESIVQLLLDKGADINLCDTNKQTPLHIAIELGRESIVQLLLDKGADINSCDENNETALHKARKKGHENIVQLLLDRGADINSCDENEETPLH